MAEDGAGGGAVGGWEGGGGGDVGGVEGDVCGFVVVVIVFVGSCGSGWGERDGRAGGGVVECE